MRLHNLVRTTPVREVAIRLGVRGSPDDISLARVVIFVAAVSLMFGWYALRGF
jgi:hypothetical protein